MAAFPRRPKALTYPVGHEPAHATELQAMGKCGRWEACVDLHGDIIELFEEGWPKQGRVGDMIKAMNSAMQNALGHLSRHWSEWGMDMRHALDICPYVQPAHEIRAELERARVNGRMFSEVLTPELERIVTFPCDATANAVPEILGFRKDEEATLEECVIAFSGTFKKALEKRSRIIAEIAESKPLAHDVTSFNWFRQYIRECCEDRVDDNRITVLMPVGRGGDKHFANSAWQIMQNLKITGMRVDMLLGLNQVDYPQQVESLRGDDTDIHNLYVNEATSNGVDTNSFHLLAEDVYQNPECTGEKFVIPEAHSDRNRIFAVRQQKTPWNAGKNPLQRVLVRMLVDQVHSFIGKISSKILFADADSWFIEQFRGRKPDVMDITTNGLAALMKEKNERNLEMIGARTWFAQYDERSPGGAKIPNFHLPVRDIYRLLGAAEPNYVNVMVGGGTLGDFPTVLALLAVISHRYPGSRVEDLHYSTIAHHAGVRWGSSETAYVSNEVRQDSLDQTKRWFAGGQGLRKLYAGTPNPLDAMIDSQKLRRDFSGSKWTKAMEEYEEVVAWAKEHPDDVRTGDASWNA